MRRKEKSKLRELIEEYGIKDMNDVHEFVKMLTAETIQTALDDIMTPKSNIKKSG